MTPRVCAPPPGSLPIDGPRSAVRRYRAGIIDESDLIAAIDRHGDALEAEIARKAVADMADFQRTVRRLEVLAGRVSLRVAQMDWLKRFPAGQPVEPVPLMCGRRVEVPRMLDALRDVELDQRVVTTGAAAPARPDGRRGAAASMAALSNAGVSVTDVALELDADRRHAWRWLNGHMPAPPELRYALERLVGIDQAATVLDGIPQHPRARARPGRAVEALHDAGATSEDVAALIPVQPGTVRRWLNGQLRASPKLGAALEQLLGVDQAATVLELIPSRNGTR